MAYSLHGNDDDDEVDEEEMNEEGRDSDDVDDDVDDDADDDDSDDRDIDQHVSNEDDGWENDRDGDDGDDQDSNEEDEDDDIDEDDEADDDDNSSRSSATSSSSSPVKTSKILIPKSSSWGNLAMNVKMNMNRNPNAKNPNSTLPGGGVGGNIKRSTSPVPPSRRPMLPTARNKKILMEASASGGSVAAHASHMGESSSTGNSPAGKSSSAGTKDKDDKKPKFRIKLRVGHNNTSSEDLTGIEKAKAKGTSMTKKGKMMLPIQSTKRDRGNDAPSDRDEEEEAEFDDDDDDVPMAIPVEEKDATALVTANEKIGSNVLTNDNNDGDSSDDDHAPLTSFKTKKKVSTNDGEKKKKKKKKKKKPSGSGDAIDDKTKKKKKKKEPLSSSSSTIPDSKKSTSHTANDGNSKPSSKPTTNKPSTSSTSKPSSKPATAASSFNSNHNNNKSKSKSTHQTFGHHQNHHHHHHHIKSKSINANFRGVAAAHRNKQIHIPPMGSPGLLLVPNGALLSVFPVDADDNADAGAADATFAEGKEKGTVNVKNQEDGDVTATDSKSIKPVSERDSSSNAPKNAASVKKESSATKITSKSNSDKSNSDSNTSNSAVSATDNGEITKDKDKDKDNDKEPPPNPQAKYLYKNQYLLPRTVFSHAMIAGGYTLEKRKMEPHRGSSTERTVHDMFDSDAGGMYLHFPELIPEVFWERRLDFRDEEAKVERDGVDEKKDGVADGGGNASDAMDRSGSGEMSGSKNGVNEKEENRVKTESNLKIEPRKSGDNEADMKNADTPNVNNEECEESMSQKPTQVVKNNANSDALVSKLKPNSDSILPVSSANREAKNDGNLEKLSTDPASDDVEMNERVHSNDEMVDYAQVFEPAQKGSDAAVKAPSEAQVSIKSDNNGVGSDEHITLKTLQAEQSTAIKVKEDTDATEVIPDASSVIKTEDSDTNSFPASRKDQTNVAEGSSDAMDIAKGESAVAETATVDVKVKVEKNETHICSEELTKEKANALTSKDDIEVKTSPPTASQKGLESNKNSLEETPAEASPNEQHTTKGARLVDMVILGLSKIVRDRSNLEEQDCELPCATKAESSCHIGSKISTSHSKSEQTPQSISTALTLDDIPKLLPSYPPKNKKRRRPHEPMSFLDMIPISLTATYTPDYVAKRRDYAKAVQARELAIIESQETADDAADALEKYQAHTDAWERMLQYQKDQIAKRVEERLKTKEAKKAEKEAAAAAKAVEGEGRNERNQENGDEKESMEKSDSGDENDDSSCEDVMEDPMDYMPPRPEPPSPARVITVPDIPIPPSPPTVVEIDEDSDDGVMNDDMSLSQSGATTAPMRVPKLKSKLLQHLDPSCFLPTLEGRYFGLLSNGIADPQFVGTNAPGLRGITSGGGTGLATSYVGGGRGGAAGLVTGPTARAVSAMQMHTSFSSSTSMAKIVAPKLKEEPPNTTFSAPADPVVEKPTAKKEKTTTKLEGKTSKKKDSYDAKTTSSESKKKSSDSTKTPLSSKKSKRPSAADDVSDSAKKKRRRTTPLTTGERNTTATEIGSGPAGHEFPDGWTVKTYRRAGGETIGKTDRFWFSPGLNIRFRAKKHARAFVDILKEPNVNGDEELAANVYRARGHHF